MSNYDNTNTVILFRNERKETEKHPDYTGTWTGEDGEEYYASCWINESKNGKKFFKVSRGKTKEREAIQSEPKREPVNDDIPFN